MKLEMAKKEPKFDNLEEEEKKGGKEEEGKEEDEIPAEYMQQ